MVLDVIQSHYCLECIKLHVEYVNLLLNETFVMEKTSPENPSEKAILKEKTCHKDLEVSVVIY